MSDIHLCWPAISGALHLPLAHAASCFGLTKSQFSSQCSSHHLTHWPYRRVNTLRALKKKLAHALNHWAFPWYNRIEVEHYAKLAQTELIWNLTSPQARPCTWPPRVEVACRSSDVMAAVRRLRTQSPKVRFFALQRSPPANVLSAATPPTTPRSPVEGRKQCLPTPNRQCLPTTSRQCLPTPNRQCSPACDLTRFTATPPSYTVFGDRRYLDDLWECNQFSS